MSDNEFRIPLLLSRLKEAISEKFACRSIRNGLQIDDENKSEPKNQIGGMSLLAIIIEDGDILLTMIITPPLPIENKGKVVDYVTKLCDEYNLILKISEDAENNTIQFGVAMRFRGHRDLTELYKSFEHSYDVLAKFHDIEGNNIGCWIKENRL